MELMKYLPGDGEGISLFAFPNTAKEVPLVRVAAIGIGSNSLRMLIADIEGCLLKRVKRYREGLRVFAALDSNRNITDQMIADACQSVTAFQEEAVRKGASQIHLFATSAVRDAANQAVFAQTLEERTGLVLDICCGEMEANLSFWGAASEKKCGLIDIGGGSTEIAVGLKQEINHAISLQMGAVRLYRMQPISSVAEAEKVVSIASDIVKPHIADFLAFSPDEWIGVGGTFTAGAAFVRRLPWQDRTGIQGFLLTQESVEQSMKNLAPLPLEERLELPFLQPQRADIVVHGMAILLACMRELDIPAISVSECGNLEGYLKAKYLF